MSTDPDGPEATSSPIPICIYIWHRMAPSVTIHGAFRNAVLPALLPVSLPSLPRQNVRPP